MSLLNNFKIIALNNNNKRDWKNCFFLRLKERINYVESKNKNIIKEINALLINFKINNKKCVVFYKDSREFFILDFSDHVGKNLLTREVVYLKECLFIIKCQYRNMYDNAISSKISPFSYLVHAPLEYESFNFNNVQKTLDKIFFYGNGWQNRNKIISNIGEDIILKSNERISYNEFCMELAKQKIGLSLPGFGNICHREIEYFGVKTPVIMPKLKNSFYNELIPNFHYISVDTDTTKEKSTIVGRKIRERYMEVKNDEEFLEFISKNAYEWYINNCTLDASINLFLKILQEKIFNE